MAANLTAAVPKEWAEEETEYPTPLPAAEPDANVADAGHVAEDTPSAVLDSCAFTLSWPPHLGPLPTHRECALQGATTQITLSEQIHPALAARGEPDPFPHSVLPALPLGLKTVSAVGLPGEHRPAMFQ